MATTLVTSRANYYFNKDHDVLELRSIQEEDCFATDLKIAAQLEEIYTDYENSSKTFSDAFYKNEREPVRIWLYADDEEFEKTFGEI